MHEEDLWSGPADDLSNTVSSHTAPKHVITTAINAKSKPTPKEGNSNEAILYVNLSPSPIQPPTPLTPLPPTQPILEDLWGEIPDTMLTASLPVPTTLLTESLSGLEQDLSGFKSPAGEQVSLEPAPEEETDDLLGADLWRVLDEEEDEAGETTFEEESSDESDEFETISLQEKMDSPTDWSTSSSSAEEINSDFFAALEQPASPPDFKSSQDADTLLANFGLIDIEAELAEQERLEAEENAQPPEIEVIRARGGWGASGWGGNSSILYINWADESKAEQEALERLGYSTITLSEVTRDFIIQAAQSAHLTGQRERYLTRKLAEARTRLAVLPSLSRREAYLKALQTKIADLEDNLRSVYLTEHEQQSLALQLSNAHYALTQIFNEINSDPNKTERNALKATITDTEKQLVTQLQWVAVKKATHFLGQGIELDDLIQIGMLGVIAGIRHFDPDRHARLLVVVNWWVFQAFTRALADYGRLIHLPVYIHEALTQIKKQLAEMEIQLGRLPTHQELANEMQVSLDDLEHLLRADKQFTYLSRYISREHTREGYSFQPVERSLVIDEDVLIDEMEEVYKKEKLKKLFSKLTAREQRTIELRYGIDTGDWHTLEEVGNKLGLTRERVRQIQDRALKKLTWYSQYKPRKHQQLLRKINTK